MALLLCNPRIKPRSGARLNPNHWAGHPTLQYLFNQGSGNLRDISGHANTGTVASGATWAPNSAGMAFNGTSGHVTAAANTVQGTACWLSCYVQFNSVGGNLRRFIAGQEDSGGFYSCGLIDYDGELSRGLRFWVKSGNGQSFAATPSASWAVAGLVCRLDGTWDGNTIKLYVNGAIVGTGTLAGGSIVASNPFMLGYDPLQSAGTGVGGQCYLAGYLNGVAAYPFAATAAQIWQLYQRPYAMVAAPTPRRGFFGPTAAPRGYVGYLGGSVGSVIC